MFALAVEIESVGRFAFKIVSAVPFENAVRADGDEPEADRFSQLSETLRVSMRYQKTTAAMNVMSARWP